jgi:hypothetical protein
LPELPFCNNICQDLEFAKCKGSRTPKIALKVALAARICLHVTSDDVEVLAFGINQ